MNIKFTEGTVLQINNAVENGKAIVSSFLKGLENHHEIEQSTVSSLSPGLSGAGVFKITSIGKDRYPRSPQLLKIAHDIDLIARERDNYIKLVKDRWHEVPKLQSHSSNILLYEFGGSLNNYNPTTLRSGYSQSSKEALSILMGRLVESLGQFHINDYDTMPFVERLNFDVPLSERIKKFSSIPESRVNKLLDLWRGVQTNTNRHQFIKCVRGHGDLNSGNVLFQPGKEGSYPIFIDFASMIDRDTDADSAFGKVLPFSDFAKIERDLKTRMFLKEALSEGLGHEQIISAIHSIDMGRAPELLDSSESIKKLAAVVSSFRNAIKAHYSPNSLDAAYSVAVAYISLSVLNRKVEDSDVDSELQARLAVETAINVLESPVNFKEIVVKGEEKRTTTVIESGLHILRTEEIRAVYDQMGQGDFAWIFSTDGFIETKEKAFFDIISRAVKNDINMYYFFPRTIRGKVSFEAFSTILTGLIREIGDSALKKVQGFFVSAEGMSLSAQSSRFVVFGKSKENEKYIDRILLYVHSGGDFWIEMDKVALRDDFIAEMQSAIDRVECRPLNVWQNKWELPSHVQTAYRTSFQSSKTTGEYQSVRELLNIKAAVKNFSTQVAKKLKARKSPRRPFLEWLDIGCENGENTAVIFSELNRNQLKISLTAIETSPQDLTKIDPVLKFSAFLNDPEWTFEQFAEKTQHDYEFDLITSIHSWYVIDPIHLIDAYRMLCANGIFAMIIAPYNNNVLNTIIGAIDKHIAGTNGWLDPAYEEKVIADDPYRNFAEDIESACHKFFGKTGVETEKRYEWIPREKLMTDGKLTIVAKKIVGFFCHNLIEPDDELYIQVETALEIYKDKEWFPCEEWNIILDHKSIASSPELESFNINSKAIKLA